MSFINVGFNTDSNIAVVKIDNGPLNVLSSEVAKEIHHTFLNLKNNKKLRAIILTGTGTRAFMAGADIKEFAEIRSEEAEEHLRIYQDAFLAMSECPVPVIAAVNGLAMGGGCELALACDIRLAARTAKIGLPEVHIGLIPAAGGTQRLSRVVGVGYAKELLYTSKVLSAEEALAIGLVNHVVEDEKLADAAMDMANKIASMAPIAVRLAKKAVDDGIEIPLLRKALELETKLAADCFISKDFKEGVNAFIEKRHPVFVDL
jgi:enoyl-CoA hydratase/carnithine racemase